MWKESNLRGPWYLDGNRHQFVVRGLLEQNERSCNVLLFPIDHVSGHSIQLFVVHQVDVPLLLERGDLLNEQNLNFLGSFSSKAYFVLHNPQIGRTVPWFRQLGYSLRAGRPWPCRRWRGNSLAASSTVGWLWGWFRSGTGSQIKCRLSSVPGCSLMGTEHEI